MKCPQLFSMPEALRIWLEDELEARGIDTVYSHHILSILQHKKLKDSSIQATGIESLVDELRTKLKKFESEDEKSPRNTFGSSGSLPSCSFQNTILFAESGQKFSESRLQKTGNSASALPTFTSAWSCPSYNERKFPKCAFGRNLSNLVVENKEKSSTSILKKWEEENKENQASKENVGTKEKMRSRSRSTVKQQNAHKTRKNMAKSLDRKDDLLKVKVTLDGGSKARKLELANEARAMWAPEKTAMDECALPMDFQQLLESPDNSSMPMEFYKNMNNKRQQINSFIQCGTNITSSIWSNSDMAMECTQSNDNKAKASKQWSSGGGGDTPWNMEMVGGYLNSKWSDVEGTSLQINDGGHFYSAFDEVAQHDVIDSSLSALNHNKEDSCFMEVVPNKLPRYDKYKNSVNSGYVGSLELKNIWDAKGEEVVAGAGAAATEDLLTSMRTHFQPIAVREQREEEEEVERPALPPPTPTYEDGTTFQISSSIDKVYFERSQSGALYLDADNTQKYREFRDAFIEYPGVFRPKYRVCQNEKFCQTEDVDNVREEEEEDEEADDLYFPGDEKQVEDCIERDSSTATVITVGGWVTAWPASIWSNDTTHSLCDVWGQEVNGDARKAVEEQYIKLKDEILVEGEELLSNLSSMQDLFLNSDDSASALHSSQAAALINFSRG